MSDPHPARAPEKEDKRTFLQKVVEFIHPGPDSPEELKEALADAENNDVIGADSRVMLERDDAGVRAVATRCGFGTAETMRRAFLRQIGVAPDDYRKRFR